jgi:hypothetical protein
MPAGGHQVNVEVVNATAEVTVLGPASVVVQQANTEVEVAVGGAQGPTGPTGATGATGPQGPSGVIAVTAPITNSGTSTSANIGVTVGTTAASVASGDRGLPVGGTTAQVLAKSSATDYAVSWVNKVDQVPSVGRETDANIQVDMYSIPGTFFSNAGNRSFQANRMHMWIFPVNRPVTISKYVVNIVANSTVATSTVRFGIYSISDNLATTSLVQEFPVLSPAAGATGLNITTLAAPLTLQPGMYALAWNLTAGTAITLRGGNNTPQGWVAGNINPMAFIRATGTTSAASPMPSTFPTPWRMETDPSSWGPMGLLVWAYA